MPISNAAFLAEIEEFLASCDVPILPSIQDRSDGDVNSEDFLLGNIDPQTRSTSKRKQWHKDVVSRHHRVEDSTRHADYRQRQRAKRDILLHQVEELKIELAEQQKEKAAQRVLSAPTWKMVAQRQLDALLTAEAEQQRLRAVATAQAALIREFRGLFDERLSGGATGSMNRGIDDTLPYKRLRIEPFDAELYTTYIKRLDLVHAQTDEVLESCGLDAADAHWDASKQAWKEDAGYFQFTDKQMIPVDFQQTCHTRWQAAPLLHRQEDRQRHYGVEDPDNTLAIKFRITKRLSSGDVASVVQRIVIRRYEQDNRLVVVWQSFQEGEGLFTGMHAVESGWGVATSTDPQKSGTVLRTCVRNVPMHVGCAVKHESTVKQFTSMVLDSGTENNVEITKTLEKLFLTR